jgi:hypothetical protein
LECLGDSETSDFTLVKVGREIIAADQSEYSFENLNTPNLLDPMKLRLLLAFGSGDVNTDMGEELFVRGLTSNFFRGTQATTVI